MRCGLGGIEAPSVAALAEVAKHGAHVEEEQRGEGKAVGHRDRRQSRVANGEDLALLGGDVACSTGSPPAPSATSSNVATSSRQRSGRSLAASTAPPSSRIAPPR